jgi:hypothetical protein
MFSFAFVSQLTVPSLRTSQPGTKFQMGTATPIAKHISVSGGTRTAPMTGIYDEAVPISATWKALVETPVMTRSNCHARSAGGSANDTMRM